MATDAPPRKGELSRDPSALHNEGFGTIKNALRLSRTLRWPDDSMFVRRAYHAQCITHQRSMRWCSSMLVGDSSPFPIQKMVPSCGIAIPRFETQLWQLVDWGCHSFARPKPCFTCERCVYPRCPSPNFEEFSSCNSCKVTLMCANICKRKIPMAQNAQNFTMLDDFGIYLILSPHFWVKIIHCHPFQNPSQNHPTVYPASPPNGPELRSETRPQEPPRAIWSANGIFDVYRLIWHWSHGYRHIKDPIDWYRLI